MIVNDIPLFLSHYLASILQYLNMMSCLAPALHFVKSIAFTVNTDTYSFHCTLILT